MTKTERMGRAGSPFAEKIVLLLLLLCGFAVRLYDLTDPPLDFHASRQLRSAIIARSFYYADFVPSGESESPTISLASDLAQLERYEPPIMEWIMSRMDRVIGAEQFWTGRIFSAFFWTLGGLFIYLIGRRFAPPGAVFLTLLVYFFLPFSIIAGRSVQPDPWMCAWVIITAWALVCWMEKPSVPRLLLAGGTGGFAILIKVFAGFFVGFMFLGCLLVMLNRETWRRTLLHGLFGGLVMLAPSLVYYLVLNPGRSGDFLSFWVVSLSGMILTSKFYAGWIAMIKGLTGLILPLLALWGVLLSEKRLCGLLSGWWAGYFLYGLTVPYQTMTHEYYSLILVPLIAVSLLPLGNILVKGASRLPKIRQAGITGVAILAAGYGAYAACGTLRGTNYTLEPASWRRVAQAIPAGATFIALTGDYGLRLNYFGWRNPDAVWPDSKDAALFSLAGRDGMDFETYFTAQTAGNDFFLVTVSQELDAQPELHTELVSHPVYYAGNGFTIYDLRETLPENE